MGTSVHFRGQQCARIQVHGAVTLKTQSPDNTRKGFCDFKMSGEQPRQPKDLQGLLKFCMEATANEDAPAVPGDPAARLAAMEPERRAWLEEALDKMSVDVVEQLGNGIKVDGRWCRPGDQGGGVGLLGGLAGRDRHGVQPPHASLRSGGAHLVGEIGQNNPYCQQRFLEEGFLQKLLDQLDKDTDPHCQVKALYAVSCLVRESKEGLAKLAELDGWSVL